MSEEKRVTPWWMDEEQVDPWGEEVPAEREERDPRRRRGEQGQQTDNGGESEHWESQ